MATRYPGKQETTAETYFQRGDDGGLCATLHKVEQEFLQEEGSSMSCFYMLLSKDVVGFFPLYIIIAVVQSFCNSTVQASA